MENVIASKEWVKSLLRAGVESGFFSGEVQEEEIEALVPTMTSNTTPEGEAICSSEYSGFPAYYAFDKNESHDSRWVSAVVSPSADSWIGYKFTAPTKVKAVDMLIASASGHNDTIVASSVYSVEASNDGIEWTTLKSGISLTEDDFKRTVTIEVDNNDYYMMYRLYIYGANVTGSYYSLTELQFYGTKQS